MYFLGADFVIKTHLSTKGDHIIQVSVSLSNVFKLCFCIHESTLCFLNSSPQFIDPSILHHNFCVKKLGSFFAITKLHSVCNLNCYVRLCSFWKNLRLCAHHSVSFPMFTSIPTTVVDEYAWEFVPNLEIYKQFVWHFVWWTSWPMNNHQNCIFSCRGINVQLKLTMKDLGHPLVTPHSSSKSALDCSIHKYHKSCINFHSYLKTDLPESILPPFSPKICEPLPIGHRCHRHWWPTSRRRRPLAGDPWRCVQAITLMAGWWRWTSHRWETRDIHYMLIK